jgi:hypothetical protein
MRAICCFSAFLKPVFQKVRQELTSSVWSQTTPYKDDDDHQPPPQVWTLSLKHNQVSETKEKDIFSES